MTKSELAAAHWRGKGARADGRAFQKLGGALHDYAFAIAGVADIKALSIIKGGMADALLRGESFDVWASKTARRLGGKAAAQKIVCRDGLQAVYNNAMAGAPAQNLRALAAQHALFALYDKRGKPQAPATQRRRWAKFLAEVDDKAAMREEIKRDLRCFIRAASFGVKPRFAGERPDHNRAAGNAARKYLPPLHEGGVVAVGDKDIKRMARRMADAGIAVAPRARSLTKFFTETAQQAPQGVKSNKIVWQTSDGKFIYWTRKKWWQWEK